MLKTVGFPSTRTGDQTIVNGNLVIGTAGKGIDFSADPSAPGMTSALLDDYEKGNWTPSVAGTGGSPTYSIQVGKYVVVGSVVFCEATLQFSVSTSGASAVTLEGLPFASDSTANNFATPSLFPILGFGGVWTMLSGSMAPSSTSINLYLTNPSTGSNFATMTAGDLGTDVLVRFAIAYVR